jgi:hypothetical protein
MCCETRRSVILGGVASAADATVTMESKKEELPATCSATIASSGLNVAAGNLEATEGLIFLAVGEGDDGDVADKADWEHVKGE